MFVELKLMSILDNKLGNPANDRTIAEEHQRSNQVLVPMIGFLFDRHLPRLPNRDDELLLPRPALFPRPEPRHYEHPLWTYVNKIDSNLNSVLNTIDPGANLMTAAIIPALDLLADEEFLDHELGHNLIVPHMEGRAISELSRSEKELMSYLNLRTTEIYNQYTYGNQCGILLENGDFMAKIKMAIGIELRRSETYRDFIDAKAVSYEEDFHLFNDNPDTLVGLQLINDEALSPLEINFLYMRLSKQIVNKILDPDNFVE